jgi:hypothetical protein
MSHPLRWPACIVASALLLAVLVASGTEGPLRLGVTLWFLLVCTGMAFVPLWRITSLSTELLVGLAASVALDAIVATVLLLAGRLSASSGLAALTAVCLVGCGAQAAVWAQWRREAA